MTIETLKKKVAAAFPLHETYVGKRGDYCQITIKLRHQAELVGFYPLSMSYDQIDFKAIAEQCSLEEAKNVANAVYIIEGTGVILADAFQYYRMAELVIPSSVNSIQEYAFAACHDLKKVRICDGVQKIDKWAFNNCTSLQSIELPDSVTEIGVGAFSGCSMLEEVKLPANIKSIPKDLFNACYALKSVAIAEGVTVIGKSAFRICKSLQDIKIPQSVERIVEKAFSECSSLTNLTIPSSVRYIGPYAFVKCQALRNVRILSTDIQIEQGAFQLCTALESVSFSNDTDNIINNIGFEDIPTYLFNGCKALKEFQIPSTVKTIGEGAFNGCSSLTKIELPQELTTIGKEAFSGCSLIDNIAIPSSVTQIGAKAFWKTAIRSTIIFNNVLNYVPQNTSGRFVVPNGVERIEAYVFSKTDITDIDLPNTIREIGESAFEGCSKLQNIDIPSQVKEIKEDTFSGCTSLSNVTLPDNLESIQDRAFQGCAIHRLIIPGKVTSIGIRAFAGCNALSELTITKYIPVYDIAKSAFYDCRSLSTVNLPGGLTWSKLKYHFTDTPWGKNPPVKVSAAAAKRQKIVELENASYKVIIDAVLSSHHACRTEVLVENTSIKVLAELPNKTFIVAKFPLTDEDGRKIPVTQFNCEDLKKLVEIALPNTTYWLYPAGTVIKQFMTQQARTFTDVTDNLVLLPGVIGIGDHAFEGFKGLRHVTLPGTCALIGLRCFAKTDLEEAIIRHNTLICAPIGSTNPIYTIPDTVRNIAPYAFEGYVALEEVLIPPSVELIDEHAFEECKSLHRVEFANPVKLHSFMWDKMKYIKPEPTKGFTTVDYSAFSGCDAINDFVVPNSGELLGSIINRIYIVQD